MSGLLASAVASALKSVGASLPELKRTMTADGVSASVVLASSVDKGLDAATMSGAGETRRFVAQVEDFPELAMDTLVEIEGTPFLITSLRSTGEAAWFFGVSDALDIVDIAFRGTRREHARVRAIEFPLPALVTELDETNDSADAVAMNSARTWAVVIRTNDWRENTRPDVGDTLAFSKDGEAVTAKVADVTVHKGYFLISARS